MKTIPQFVRECAAKFQDKPYIWQYENDGYKAISYNETLKLTEQFCAGLISCGFERGDIISLMSEGRNEWIISETGALFAGASCVPLSVKLDDPIDIIYRVKHSESKAIFVSESQRKKIIPLMKELPALKHIISYDKNDSPVENELFFDDIMTEGIKALESNPNIVKEREALVTPHDTATISYTSGTTSDPKGIMLSHHNYMTNVEQSGKLVPIPSHFKTLLILPWDHSFGHTVGIYSFMSMGGSLASIQPGKTAMETLRNIPKNIKEIQPHVILSVPALAKNFRKNIETGIMAKGKTLYSLFEKALKNADKIYGNGFEVSPLKYPCRRFLHFLADKILFSKIRQNFGGNLQYFIGGGALLDIELQKFFYAIGIPMYQGYGLTEASPIISSNTPKRHKMGSSGVIVPMMDIKICDDKGKEVPQGITGEIVIRGGNVMKGYWKNEEATNKSIRNEWLYTEDLGYIDSDNFLYVVGRSKSLLISNDGEKYSPEGYEEALVEKSTFVDQCMIHNNQNAYTICLLSPNKSAILRFIKENNLDTGNENDLKKILDKIHTEMDKFKTGEEFEGLFPQRWLPAATGILPEGFTEQNQQLNSTMKMVRGNIKDDYIDLIEYLYTPEGKNIKNEKNLEILNSLLN
jgi:long-chain acyl-CoA synthetase